MNSLWDIRIFLGLVPKESPCIYNIPVSQNSEENRSEFTGFFLGGGGHRVQITANFILMYCVKSVRFWYDKPHFHNG